MENLQEIAVKASAILEVVENYQFELGRLSNEVVESYGYKALTEFAKEIEGVGGVRRSPSTLRVYAYIWKVSNKLGLPKDLLFSGCQRIVFSDDPEKYARLAKAGATNEEIRRAIYEDKKA